MNRLGFNVEVSENGGTPIAGWFIMANLTRMNDLGVPPWIGNLNVMTKAFEPFVL